MIFSELKQINELDMFHNGMQGIIHAAYHWLTLLITHHLMARECRFRIWLNKTKIINPKTANLIVNKLTINNYAYYYNK